MKAIDCSRVHITGGFWHGRQAQAAAMLLASFDTLEDKGFLAALRGEKRPQPPTTYCDAYVAQWLYAATCAVCSGSGDEPTRIALREKSDAAAALLAARQDKDGYISGYFQTYEPAARFTRRTAGELYCAAQILRAAAARATLMHQSDLLPVAERLADCIRKAFVLEGTAAFVTPGRCGIESALYELYRLGGDSRHLDTARFFLQKRGERAEEFFEWADKAYHQSHLPVAEQTEAVGECVSALSLYTAMAEIGAGENDTALLGGAQRLFADLERQVYVTGACGIHRAQNAFTFAYDLPVCGAGGSAEAAAALVRLCAAMSSADSRPVCHELTERALFNALASVTVPDGGARGTVPQQLRKNTADALYAAFDTGVPPLGALGAVCAAGGAAFAEESGCVYINQYMTATAETRAGAVAVETDLPYGGRVTVTAPPDARLCLRIPAWSEGYTVQSGTLTDGGDGYLHGRGSVQIEFTLRPRFVYGGECTADCAGRKAVTFGPLLLCAESDDNGPFLPNLCLNAPEGFSAAQTGERFTLSLAGKRLTGSRATFGYAPPRKKPVTVRLVPYCDHGSRGKSDLQVWFL